MSNKNEINLENKIMGRVISGEVKMKPRLYFILGSIMSFVGLVGLITGSVFFTNLTLFLIRKQGPGTGRLLLMLDSFPLWVPFLAVLLVILGSMVLKKYDFSYKRNFPVLVLTLLIAVLLSAKIIDSLGLNEIWSRRGPMKRFYTSDQQEVLGKQGPRYNRY
ncbi:hypothetical protein A2380_01485 [candidate division WWE3 bacterium RIFOXYB1_FULL_43_24]|uniref:Uncharacterized protein n=1 Tax=candidate division WWE3 bacterium GW2011_GWF1_42_14 TaxID=1619138 RepID=A0A0G0YLQ8_UNCKA|nr:MAG: hypothetical protein UU92_C0010G0006 [candidate division WWE3 bacterium GW2011_GWA1_42_12]KKS34526.1 MAG: hypothetical protein UU97_C0009G0006 [candidate division WWE3 bacterium GW2011_GWD1_42_14]KKS37707.1 MAG: hypothetical protein UV00_C0012G0006 [candidate division WWE3 bacterium GW2011_GWF1_42_14]KKS40150.1 MAG: hypothetical protein UV03_C0011G0006 [candidate division WWE3 bacterium GW2011_GWE1_42_16]OGC59546.1 MAG: hypothetical protein A2212_01215 [candidate division WWE3 bacterium